MEFSPFAVTVTTTICAVVILAGGGVMLILRVGVAFNPT
jgi:hypothetical protein